MRITKLVLVLGLLVLPDPMEAQIVQHVPLMGAIFAPPGAGGEPQSASYRTETRIWNRGSVPASVTITDTVGVGTPTLTSFTIPSGAVLDLPFYGVFADPNTSGPFLATVEFTSTEPIDLTTLLSGELSPPCASTIPLSPRPDWAGDCKPIGGPLVKPFAGYLQPSDSAALGWLTADTGNYRTNLFVTNPGNQPIEVTGEFRSFDGSASASKAWTIPARSLTPIQDIFNDPLLQPIVAANRTATPPQGAATGLLHATGPFYVFAATINQSFVGGDSTNRFTISQP